MLAGVSAEKSQGIFSPPSPPNLPSVHSQKVLLGYTKSWVHKVN